MSDEELRDRIALIESMMKQGRKSTEKWGWNFVLWGVAYLIAVAWSSFLPFAAGKQVAWPVTMIAAAILTAAISRMRLGNRPRTEKSRHIHAIWVAVGLGIFVFALPTGYSSHWEVHASAAAIEVLLGVAHIASGMMLRWPVQVSVGSVWWVAAVASCFVNPNGVALVFLAATLVCNIGFGIYLMILEGRDRTRSEGALVQHA